MTPNCLFFYLFTGSLLLIHTALLPQAFRYLRNGSRLQDIPRDIREFLRPPPHRLLGRFPLPALSPAGTMALGIALTLCLLTALISPAELLTRIALGIAGVVSLLYFPQLHDLNFVRRKANTVPVILFILSAAPGISPAPQSPVAAWPVLAAGILAVQVYFSAGVEKIRASGFSWARGDVLRWAIIEHELWHQDVPKRLHVPAAAAMAGSAAALWFELAAPLALLAPEAGMVFALTAAAFHAANSWILRIHYHLIYPALTAGICLWVTPPLLWFSGIPDRAATALLALLLCGVTATGRRLWPFDRYPMYSAAPPGPIVTHRLELVDARGIPQWWKTGLSSDLERICQLFNQRQGQDPAPVIKAALQLSNTPPETVRFARIHRRECPGNARCIQTLVHTMAWPPPESAGLTSVRR